MIHRAIRLALCLSTSWWATACGQSPDGLPDTGAYGWPDCPDGGVPFGDQCVDESGLSPCELIEARGGCPEGHYCVEGIGCIEGILCGDQVCPLGTHCNEGGGCAEGVACGDTYCAQGEFCIEGSCTCTDSDPSTPTPDAACPPGQICVLVMTDVAGEDLAIPVCVDPAFDGDGDGVPAGDLDGDGLRDDCDDLDPAIGPSSPEVCDGADNDCDGLVDEGFDVDGDGYTTCGYGLPDCDPDTPGGCPGGLLYGPDCDDSDPSVNPGAVDLCALGPDGNLTEPDCDATSDSCPFGSQCCPGVEGCVHTDYDHENCGGCGQACTPPEFCVVGVCRDAFDGFDTDPDEGEVVLDAEPGPANHPDVAFNWMRMNDWFSWSERVGWRWFTHWYQFSWWELDYGIAWVQTLPGDRGALLFTGRHFVSSPITPLAEVGDAVGSMLDGLRGIRWYDTQVIDFLDGEDTILCLAPGGGLGYGLVWSDEGGGGTQLRFASIGQYGRLTGWSQQLTHGNAENLYPRLAYGPYYYYMGASYGLVYQREDDDDVQIYFQNVQGYWDWWAPFGVGWRISSNEGGALNPDIAWSPYGYGVVWVGAEDSNLYFALIGTVGGFVRTPVQITFDNNAAAWRPSIGWNHVDGEFAIAYQATSPPAENQDIYFLRLGPFGSPYGSPQRLTSDPDLQRHPDMAFAGDGWGITWYDRRSGVNEIAFIYLDRDGSVIEGPTMITDHGADGEAANPAITHASVTDMLDGVSYGLAGWAGGELLGNGEFGLVWRDQEASTFDPQVRFLRLTPSE